MITLASHTWVGRATLSPARRPFRALDLDLDPVQTLVLVLAQDQALVQARDQVQVLPSGLNAVV